MAKQRRGYSRAFTSRGSTKRYMLDAIPAGFWRSVRKTAKARGVSLRALILTLLEDWVVQQTDADKALAELKASPLAGRAADPELVRLGIDKGEPDVSYEVKDGEDTAPEVPF